MVRRSVCLNNLFFFHESYIYKYRAGFVLLTWFCSTEVMTSRHGSCLFNPHPPELTHYTLAHILKISRGDHRGGEYKSSPCSENVDLDRIMQSEDVALMRHSWIKRSLFIGTYDPVIVLFLRTCTHAQRPSKYLLQEQPLRTYLYRCFTQEHLACSSCFRISTVPTYFHIESSLCMPACHLSIKCVIFCGLV